MAICAILDQYTKEYERYKNSEDNQVAFFHDRSLATELLQNSRAFSQLSSEILLLNDIEKRILTEGLAHFANGKMEFRFSGQRSEIVELLKRGILIKTGYSTFAFPSPLHFDLVLYALLNGSLRLESTEECFETFIIEVIQRMNPHRLQLYVEPRDSDNPATPYENFWQKEFYASILLVAKYDSTLFIQTNAGRAQDVERLRLDLYISGELQWAIDLVRMDSKLQEHVQRFVPGDRYSQIPTKQKAVIDFTTKVPIERLEGVWYVVYTGTTTEATLYRSGKNPLKLHLIRTK